MGSESILEKFNQEVFFSFLSINKLEVTDTHTHMMEDELKLRKNSFHFRANLFSQVSDPEWVGRRVGDRDRTPRTSHWKD